MKKLLLTFVLLVSIHTFGQKRYYNLAVNNCKETKAENIINMCLVGSYLLNYDFKTVNGELISTDKIKTPIVIIAVSTRCAPCWAMVPALNEISEKYKNKVEFLMLFLDEKGGIDRMAKKLKGDVKLIPPTKKFENKSYTESYGFIHKLDYPTTYLIDKHKKFINIKRGAVVPSKTMKMDAVNKKNIADFEAFLAPVLR